MTILVCRLSNRSFLFRHSEYKMIPAMMIDKPMNFLRLMRSFKMIRLRRATKTYSEAAKIGPKDKGTSLYA